MSPERPKPVEFYTPVTNRARTLEKLKVLFKKIPTDVELFEAIADTFATIATNRCAFGNIVGDREFKARKWQDISEITFETKVFDNVSIGYYPRKDKVVSGEACIDRVVNTFENDISLERNRDGSISVTMLDDEEIEDRKYEIPLNQRKSIIETLLDGLNFQQPTVA